jgi:glycosyltransferase involved in cell wall biosynthesis
MGAVVSCVVGRRRDDRVVSVIVTAFNAGRYLDGCLASIVASTHRELDVVVVDDGSVDGSAEIIDGWVRREQRVRAVQLAHGGRRAALEVAHSLAHGDAQCWVDADDEVHPKGIASCLARLDFDHELVYSYRELFDAGGLSLGPHSKNRVVPRQPSHSYRLDLGLDTRSALMSCRISTSATS